MMLLTASMISALVSYHVMCKRKQQKEEEIDEKDFWAPQPLSRQRFAN